MTREEYIKITKERITNDSKNVMIEQINNYFDAMDYKIEKKDYKVGDEVYLKKGTLLHGTYKNLDGLKEIVKNGLMSSWFITDSRESKYPSSIGVWNLKKDYKLADYIDFYCGSTIMYCGVPDGENKKNITDVISYSELDNIKNIVKKYDCWMWTMEQTKESRFMPSWVGENVQIGIIFDGNNDKIMNLKKGDILNEDYINDENVFPYVNERYYDRFLIDRKNKNDFFTDRESAILFGIPSNFIEGILVGREYEKNQEILAEIKSMLPDVYICNLDGIVIET